MSFTNFLLGANLGATVVGHAATNRNLANVNAAIQAQSQQLAYAEHERRWADQINVWSRELEARGWTPIQANEEARRERARSEALAQLAEASAYYDRQAAEHNLAVYLKKSRSARTMTAWLSGLAAVGIFIFGVAVGDAANDLFTVVFFSLIAASLLTVTVWAVRGALRLNDAITTVLTGRTPAPSHWVNRAINEYADRRHQLDGGLANAIHHCQNTLRYWGRSPLHDSAATDQALTHRLTELNRTVIDLTERSSR